jgi:hypothetical protein
MTVHGNAKLGPAGRFALTEAIADAMTQRRPLSASRRRRLDADAQQRICEARRRTGWGPRLVAGQTGHPHSTVWKVLHRHGISRAQRGPRDAARRYQWPCPGDLPQIDSVRYARFARPGHRVTGDRSHPGRNWMADGNRVGYDFAHAIIWTAN